MQNKWMLLNSLITQISPCVPVLYGYIYSQYLNNLFENRVSFPPLLMSLRSWRWGRRRAIFLYSPFSPKSCFICMNLTISCSLVPFFYSTFKWVWSTVSFSLPQPNKSCTLLLELSPLMIWWSIGWVLNIIRNNFGLKGRYHWFSKLTSHFTTEQPTKCLLPYHHKVLAPWLSMSSNFSPSHLPTHFSPLLLPTNLL